jgi:hypothetical protein
MPSWEYEPDEIQPIPFDEDSEAWALIIGAVLVFAIGAVLGFTIGFLVA